MGDLTLNNSERELLLEMIAHSVSELGEEISHTDNREYRDGLKARKTMLTGLQSRLEELGGGSA